MAELTPICWAPRVSPALIRRLYETDARGIVDEELIDRVGYALLARCQAIYRVTERLCPFCGGKLDGVWEGDDRKRAISCEACAWQSTWEIYHQSYKKDRIHGGRAYPFFLAYIERFTKCQNAPQKMYEIDRLMHEVHESTDKVWTIPAAVNLIRGKGHEVIEFLDNLAYGDHVPDHRKQRREHYLKKMQESEKPTRQKLDEIEKRRNS